MNEEFEIVMETGDAFGNEDGKPEKLKSKTFLLGNARGKAILCGSPSAAFLSMAIPPGYPSPRSLAILSKASPAASSRVAPIHSYCPKAGTLKRWVWPPLTIRAQWG